VTFGDWFGIPSAERRDPERNVFEMEGQPQLTEAISGDYITVRALEDGVTIIGLTRGKETRFIHTEKLDRGEVMLLQFTEHTSAMKIRGKAEILTKFGAIPCGKEYDVK
jgi:transcription attenuation protein (tryptophan RNA-binding attenuator protein)